MLLRILAVVLTSGALFILSPALHAQSPQAGAPAATEPIKAPAAKPRPLPFQGRVKSVNRADGTFTTRTKEGREHLFRLTPESKIEKADGPATIDDINPDEIVRGSRIKLADFEWEVRRVIIGAKQPAEAGGRKKQR